MQYIISIIEARILDLIYLVPVLFIALPFHEFSHAFIATRLGDNTAKNAGRLTINPIKHLDLFGSILLVITGFGWAKPVPVNPYNFKNRKEGMALTALAGPLSNLLLGFISLFVYLKFQNMNSYLLGFFWQSAIINIGLAIFNLIPINPLDGSRILAMFLPERIEMFFYKYENYFMVILLLLMFSNLMNGVLTTLITNVVRNFSYLINLIPV